MIYMLTATGLPPGGSSTVHIYTQTIHITKQITTQITSGPMEREREREKLNEKSRSTGSSAQPAESIPHPKNPTSLTLFD
jgi:hypothetical protein